MKDGGYVINLDEYCNIETHWAALYLNNKTVTFIGNKNIITNIFRIQAYDSVMCGYFCIGFIYFLFNGNSLTYFTNLFSPNDFKKNNDIILKGSASILVLLIILISP